MNRKEECPHNALRRCKGTDYPFNAYICGNCANVYRVERYQEPEPRKDEPMFDRRPPWGLRDRQA